MVSLHAIRLTGFDEQTAESDNQRLIMRTESTTYTADLGNPRTYMRSEETINTLTHGLGCLLAAGGGIAMIVAHRNLEIDEPLLNIPLGDLVACGLFAAMLTLTFAVSALSHAVQSPRGKFRLRAWDQGVIYLLIVASMTPLIWKFVPLAIMAPSLVVIWVAAMAGFIAKSFFAHRLDDDFSPVSYLALSWIPSLAFCYYVPWTCIQWLLFGGILYTVGVAFLKLDHRVRYFHAIWHLMVIAASSCHYYAIYHYVLLPAN